MSSTSMDGVYPLVQLPFALSAIILGVLSLLYLTYQRALPKPLPGIPYNKGAAQSILGDLAEMRQIEKAGGRPRSFFANQIVRHKSPLAQAFLAPFTKPALILSDYREAKDILLRRSKEFDRGVRNSHVFRGALPWHHISMQTSDPQFKANRDLVRDLMSPNFLNTVSAPEIHINTSRFINLWKLKARLADGRPFMAEDDIHVMTFDIIKVVALGEGDDQSMTELYAERMLAESMAQKSPEGGKDDVFPFPKNESNADLESHQFLQAAVGKAATHPSPNLYYFIEGLTGDLNKQLAAKKSMLSSQVSLAVKRLEAGQEVKSALDYMLQREIAAAKKAGRNPVFDSPSMYDELYGYIGAGHDTSSTTVQWALKHLAKHQNIQHKLRESLRVAHPSAFSEGRQPTVTEVTKTPAPYLDAVTEEILRMSTAVPTLVREVTVDTVILGHPVPKGTHVFFNLNGPGYTAPGLPVDETLRSESSKAHKQETRGSWDDMDPDEFVPERWLKTQEDGTQVFDPLAGPFLTFSAGIRGCFGRRLGYLELRIIMTLLLWNFEFGELPAELNTWDAEDHLTTKPVTCFVRLSEAK